MSTVEHKEYQLPNIQIMKRPAVRMCAYCRVEFHRKHLTKDHIPPQGIYGKEWRKGKVLPWVDCCYSCREGQAKGDEALKAIIGMGLIRTGASASVRDDVSRSLDRQTWWRKLLVAQMSESGSTQVSVSGLVGTRILLGSEFSQSTDDSVQRTARGLLFLRHPDFDTRDFVFETFQYTEDMIDKVQKLITDLVDASTGPPYGLKVEDAFFAGWWLGGQPINTGIMLQNYFGGLNFFVFFYHRDHPPER